MASQRQPARAEVLFGNGDPMGAGSPFGMLGRAIRRAAGIHDGEALAARRDKLRARVVAVTSTRSCARASPRSSASSPTCRSPTSTATRCAPRAATRS